jgi:hypothetical protein
LTLVLSAILRARDAEEALGALKGSLVKAAPDSFMLWLHRLLLLLLLLLWMIVITIGDASLTRCCCSVCSDCSADVTAFRRLQLANDAASASSASASAAPLHHAAAVAQS